VTIAPTEKGNWPANRLTSALGFILKITPRHEFARYAAAKYRFRGYEWKNAREFLGRHPRGLLGRRPRTFGRRCSKAGLTHRTSSRSKRNSYIRRRAAPEKSRRSARKLAARRRNSTGVHPPVVQILTNFTRRTVLIAVSICSPVLSQSRELVLMLGFAFLYDESAANVTHAHPSCKKYWQILILQ